LPVAGLNPLKVINEVKQLCSELHVVVGEDNLSLEAKRNATLLFHAFLRATLASKRVLAEYRLTEDAFEYLIGEIKTRFYEVRVHNVACLLRLMSSGHTRGSHGRPAHACEGC